MRSSTSSAARNADLQQRQKDSPQTIIPWSFDKYYRKLVGTHGWSRPSRSKDKRQNYFVKSTVCPARKTVTVVWGGTLGFQVTQQLTEQNHALDSRSYGNHHSNRRIEDESMIDFVDELQAAGAKKKLILQFLKKKAGKHVTLRDVHNMVANLKAARCGSKTVESRLETGLRAFCSRKGNTVTIYVDDNKLAQTITFQTQQRRRFFLAFPQVLMMDATHNTNDARYKLFSFMIHDVFGHGLYVQHVLMENDSAECLTDEYVSLLVYLNENGTATLSTCHLLAPTYR
ncbi:LOW QUALITY PROTEIN: ABC transporter [Phytophthora megakarya]|uniref:ABC transporter n=1 Tax=Phytophthora megakarya TaxID=4795 RepID=A0A225UM86_9STRA|nr:LOW QUALITY PROTEIN: ABC transporter [Phytophthora megakarya]